MIRAFSRDERGASMVEFAFVAPVFLIIFFMIVEFGRALYDYDLVANDARLATRYAIVHGATCDDPPGTCTASANDITVYVQSVTTGINPSDVTVNTTWAPGVDCPTTASTTGNPFFPASNGPGCSVSVQVKYGFKFAAFGLADIPLQSTSTMTISR